MPTMNPNTLAAPPSFQTSRLHLRPLVAGDETLYCHLYTDPALMRHIGAPLTLEAAQRDFYKACALALQSGPAAQLWIIAEHGASTGSGLLARVLGATADVSELGIMLTEEGQGRGLAAEALGALTDQLFALPLLQMLWTFHAPGNASVIRLMHRMGFERGPDHDPRPAQWRWQLARDRWQSLRVLAPA